MIDTNTRPYMGTSICLKINFFVHNQKKLKKYLHIYYKYPIISNMVNHYAFIQNNFIIHNSNSKIETCKMIIKYQRYKKPPNLKNSSLNMFKFYHMSTSWNKPINTKLSIKNEFIEYASLAEMGARVYIYILNNSIKQRFHFYLKPSMFNNKSKAKTANDLIIDISTIHKLSISVTNKFVNENNEVVTATSDVRVFKNKNTEECILF